MSGYIPTWNQTAVCMRILPQASCALQVQLPVLRPHLRRGITAYYSSTNNSLSAHQPAGSQTQATEEEGVRGVTLAPGCANSRRVTFYQWLIHYLKNLYASRCFLLCPGLPPPLLFTFFLPFSLSVWCPSFLSFLLLLFLKIKLLFLPPLSLSYQLRPSPLSRSPSQFPPRPWFFDSCYFYPRMFVKMSSLPLELLSPLENDCHAKYSIKPPKGTSCSQERPWKHIPRTETAFPRAICHNFQPISHSSLLFHIYYIAFFSRLPPWNHANRRARTSVRLTTSFESPARSSN